MTEKMTRRERMRAAGGFYGWMNAWLVSKAGPAAVGPYETTPPPSVAERAERAFDRSGPKPLMHCP